MHRASDVRFPRRRASPTTITIPLARRRDMSAFTRATFGASLALALAGCGGGGGHDDLPANVAPPYLKGNIISTTYDGTSNDLLTGGLGKTGLGTGACP